jgi:hypothetical protein
VEAADSALAEAVARGLADVVKRQLG